MNKYETWYYKLIAKRQQEPYSGPFAERHHILPKSLGGSNRKENIVSLTPREHFIAHLLLFRFSTGAAKMKMSYALRMLMGMENKYQTRYTSRSRARYVEQTRSVLSENMRGEKNPFHGKTHTDETKNRMKEKRKNQPPPMLGKTHNEETRTRLREMNAVQFSDPAQIEMRRQKSKALWEDPDWRANYKGNTGKVCYHNDELQQFKMFNPTDPIPNGWVKGKKFYRKEAKDE